MKAGPLRDLLILTRAPLVATALTDGMAGAALAISTAPAGAETPASRVALALLGSASAYLAGMTFNDVFDYERDLTLAPDRPLPSGRMSTMTGALIGTGLLLTAALAAFLLGPVPCAFMAALCLGVLGYDGLTKRWKIPGALTMGTCRALNILFAGAAVAPHWTPPESLLEGLEFLAREPTAILASESFLYVSGLTLLSCYEDEEASGLMLGVVALALLAPPVGVSVRLFPSSPEGLGMALAAAGVVCELLLMGLVLTRLRAAWRDGTMASGHASTRQLIRGTVLLACGGLLLRGLWPWALACAALVPPYILGAKAVFSPPTPADGEAG